MSNEKTFHATSESRRNALATRRANRAAAFAARLAAAKKIAEGR